MKKILLIEDNENIRENTAEILELADYAVVTAEHGKRGVELAIAELPDLIVCDIMMPELDGYGVLHILNKNPKTSVIPFIFLTAKSEKTDFRKGMSLGADDYLTKPFEERELLEAIELRLAKSGNIKSHVNHADTEGVESFMNEAARALSLEAIVADRTTWALKKKDVIYREGNFPSGVYYIRSGKVKLSRISDDGKEFVTAIHGPGSFIGYLALLEGQDHRDTASVMEDAEVITIPLEQFQKLMHSDRDVSNNLIKLLAHNTYEQEERLLKLAYGNVRERVAHVLKHIHDQYGGADGALGLIISREELAGYTGIATESLIRTLSDLKSEGVITTEGRKIRILDAEMLKRLALGRPN